MSGRFERTIFGVLADFGALGLVLLADLLPMLKVIAGSSLRADVLSDERADLCMLANAGETTY